ncbi:MULTISPECIES: methylthioribose kinase [unclassified Bacillus (in: firmicutes)]|uniref:DUF7147 family protein n=1 Tax=unclassified Bacillus (in: firmicutes) TaxID=185979 RepID=UPI0008F42062|nr:MULTISPECIES: methylthioribose kinase [unclassified Bacillus (in: firmicutes)]SFA75849.1 hypothetical protein SAMN02799634_101549 [Bacillus sp. UNCCL13]SFQ65880.1 hypothetical protein SAMN04488577_0824 [Bacillus sp. cl95]
MIQRFIELGEGYSDLYELLEIARANKERLTCMLALHTKINEKDLTSLVVILKPTTPGNFQPLYVCREGIPNPNVTLSKRFDLFAETAKELGHVVHELSVKPSTIFAEKELYYQQMIGILRLNYIIPPLQ